LTATVTESWKSMIMTVSPASRADVAKMKGRDARVVSVGPQVVEMA
jgi:hypothetical protein